MGMSPTQVDALTLWEFAACQDGYILANDPKAKRRGSGEISEERLAEMGIEGF